MSFGMTSDHRFVIERNLTPVKPLGVDSSLPVCVTTFEDFDQLKPKGGEELSQQYGRGFATLANMTPNLRLYRLIQVFNTPIQSLSYKEAAKTQFAFWGQKPPGAKKGGFCHLWFFEKFVIEFGFDDRLRLYSAQQDLTLAKDLSEALLGQLNSKGDFEWEQCGPETFSSV
jgi:hypothetical protein